MLKTPIEVKLHYAKAQNRTSKGVFIATQLNSTELNSGQRPVYDVINKNTTDLLRAVQLSQFS